MLAQTLFTTAFVALFSFSVAAPPPGCLLGAVNSYSDPADVKAVCSEKDVAKTVAKFCGDASKDALSALAEICLEKGVKVSTDVSKSSGSVSATSTASGSKATASGSIIVKPSGNSTVPAVTGITLSPTATAGGAGGASGTATGGNAQFTGAAGRMEIGAAAALLGLFAIAL
ncbi:hypothetical protein CC86DRAFT_451473 [Ophiobolus disseminans]|uniref:Extracellular membrane protein CFEM domain-containing protein n=1 Tax=Ophiobolus disseminans TaxID=1469910 RepID=A0A6A7AL11_9PLEO|nr:hypothetical protein CC86DRAFT_451473 [Ophiobolus disseminans]